MDVSIKKENIKKTKKEKIYVFLIRWWCAGAVFFFIGWGTTAGSRTSILDLVLLLAIVMGLFNSFIVNPSIRMMFGIGNAKEYKDMTVAERILLRLKDVGISLAIVSLVALFYQAVNVAAINIMDLSKEAVFLPAEPILFGLLYAIIITLGGVIIKKIIKQGQQRANEIH